MQSIAKAFDAHKRQMERYVRLASSGRTMFKELVEGPTTNMTNDRIPMRLMRDYIEPENEKIKRWLANNSGLTYLDVGAGTGRFSKMALDSGATEVFAIDIDPACIDVLNQRFKGDTKFKAALMDIRNPQPSQTFDRVICLGNTLGNMFEITGNEARSYQSQALRSMLSLARREVVLTLLRPEALPIVLQYYRMNGYDVYGYSDRILEMRTRRPGPDGALVVSEMRSQTFEADDIRLIANRAGVDSRAVEIIQMSRFNWFVGIPSWMERSF